MKLLKKAVSILLPIILVVSATVTVFADETSMPTKPDDYYVCDLADVINDVTSEEISLVNTDNIKEYGEIVIVTINNSGGKSLSDYANQLFETWDIGGLADTGAMLLMDIEAENYRSIIGAGLSSYISESQLKDILDGQVEYYFAAKDYNSAASIFASSVVSKIVPETAPEEGTDTAGDDTTADVTTDESKDDVTDNATTDENKENITGDTATDENKGNSFVSVIFTIFKILLVVILILLIVVVAFLILVNIRAQKRRKNSRRSSRRRRK